ncbi:MAG TPA: glycosyltransferase family 2 protein [Patescibacteria group bacterium]|nr:glycosyltransferase family 2 protein [Patescibacteria group bacterium]
MTTILVPVYNAVAATRACLAALARSVAPETKILLIDDASTDPDISPLLDAFVATRPNARLLRHRKNLGFIRSVNRGMNEVADDVLLLNSDTLPTPGFLDRIQACAALDARIASVTPFSNNAEICSFPRFCRANPVPTDPEGEAAAFAIEADTGIDLPTAVGFCMWMRRAAIAAVGDFDAATFGRGYGEENDWCLRAAGHGWRHVLCPSAYVAHVGSASFSTTGERPGGENLKRLIARYPGYNAQVADFIARDPLAAVRARVAARLDLAVH